MFKRCGCYYGACSCSTTKDDIIKDLNKRIALLEKERDAAYEPLKRHFRSLEKREYEKWRKVKRINKKHKALFKKLITEKFTKQKAMQAAALYIECESTEEFLALFKELE